MSQQLRHQTPSPSRAKHTPHTPPPFTATSHPPRSHTCPHALPSSVFVRCVCDLSLSLSLCTAAWCGQLTSRGRASCFLLALSSLLVDAARTATCTQSHLNHLPPCTAVTGTRPGRRSAETSAHTEGSTCLHMDACLPMRSCDGGLKQQSRAVAWHSGERVVSERRRQLQAGERAVHASRAFVTSLRLASVRDERHRGCLLQVRSSGRGRGAASAMSSRRKLS